MSLKKTGGRNSWEVAQEARSAYLARVGKELMDGFNRGKTDPSDMAALGHDTATGYEFVIERDGRTFVVSVKQEE